VQVAAEPLLGGVHIKILWRQPTIIVDDGLAITDPHCAVCVNAQGGQHGLAASMRDS
jgi:hypothetical protein